MSENQLSDWKLFSPLVFLRLNYAEKRLYNIVSFIVSLSITLVYVALPYRPPLMGDGGILNDLQSLVTILFPFLVAALVSVATFQRESLDAFPIGSQVKLLRKDVADYFLKRREFICLLFGYCASLSLIIFLYVLIAKIIYRSIPIIIGPEFVFYIKIFAVFTLSLIFVHMIIVTFWGIYYLMYRINN